MKNVISTREKLINLNISYKLNPELRNLSTDWTLNICLFGSSKLTKNDVINKYKGSGHGIGFDSR